MGNKVKILIVDDTVDTVELLQKRFRFEGYETIEAYDGEEGLRKVAAHQPDLIILDVMMPKIDGFTVCKEIKKNEATKHIPVLILTAKSEIPDKVKGLDIGADGYLTKPCDPKELLASVRSLLAKKNVSRELAAREKSVALDQMVDEMSHEVRNPLVSIGGFARRVRKNLPAGDPNIKYLDIILQNVEVLEKMVSHLISLKSATISYTESANINEIVGKALQKHHEELGRKQIAVTTNLLSSPPLIAADTENLTIAVSNMIENSIEAMDNVRRELVITTLAVDGYLEIKIADTGKGISKDRIKNIYDPFFTSKTYGPGLGLSFALKTIQSHKGMILVESKENQGTTFTVRLPLTAY